jgi:MYXO-CTERM domain-containing protein
VVCPAPGECHLDGACDPTDGSCVPPVAPDGTPCPGGTCSDGRCVPSGAGGAGGEAGSPGGGGSAGGGQAGSTSMAGSGGDGGGEGLTSGSTGMPQEPPTIQESGCGCAVPSKRPRGGWWLAVLVLGAAHRRAARARA